MTRTRWSLLLGVAALFAMPLAAQDSDPGTQGEKSVTKTDDGPLSLQQRAFQKFQELQASMRRLKAELAATDSDKSKRLGQGLQWIQEKNISEAMKEVEHLLSQESWDAGIEKMQTIQKDLATLLGLLMDRDVDLQELLEEIARLENYKKRVDRLIEEQKELKDESRKAEALAEQLERIAKAKARTSALKAAQQKLHDETAKEGAGEKDVDPLAQRQKELHEDTESLEKELQELEQAARDLDAEGKPGDGKSGEGKPGEGKPSDSKPGEGKPREGKPGEGKPGEGKPGEGKPGEGQPSAGKASSQAKKAASKAGKAAESMQKSGQKLGVKQPESSLDDQEKAIEELGAVEEALEKMEEEARARLLELPFDQLEKLQKETLGATFELSKDMKKDAEGDGKDGEEGNGKPTPGSDNIEQALPKQKNAAGSLKEIKPGKAKQQQQDAQDQLEEARKRLEDALAQLRQEMQEEVLRALEERFSEMLAKQRSISANTLLTHKWRERVEAVSKAGVTPTSVKERCHRLAEGEHGLRQEAQDALQLIRAEGSGAVFPEIVEQLGADLELAAEMLDGFATDEETQGIQAQIEKTLTQLLDALTRRIEQIDCGEAGT